MPRAELVATGWNSDMAEALFERAVSGERASMMSAREAFEHFLEWNGILGYTGMFINALDNCRNMEARSVT